MGTDRYAYQSRLRHIDPAAKLVLSFAAIMVCLCCGGISAGICTLVIMGLLCTLWGGVSFRVFFRFLRIPMAFLMIGCVTIVAESYPAGTPVILGFPVGDAVWGISADSLCRGFSVFTKSMGAISAMYFLALNTPITDVTLALRRIHVPQLMIELMDLVYRFIFVLSETARQIRTAQDSRLGYGGFRRSLNSLGTLASMVFLRAWKRADKVYSALESRGYTGTLQTLPDAYEKGNVCYFLAVLVAAMQLGCFLVEVHLF